MNKNEKIKLTREEEQALKVYKSYGEGIETFIGWRDSWSNTYKPLKRLTLDEMARLLYQEDSYEIKESFKVGDWIVNNQGQVLQVTGVHFKNGIETVVDAIDSQVCAYRFNADFVRHATPEEIAKEKERRRWEKYSRKLWELKVGDILIYEDTASETSEIIEVTRVADDRIYFNDGNMEYMCDINLGYKVVCFAENRLDLQEM